jgi:hypothetical protein
MFYNLEIWAPKLFSCVIFSLLIQKAESLAGRSSDNDVSLRYFCNAFFDYLEYVVGRAVTSEIGRVSLCGIRIKIVCPNRHKDLSEELGKTERKATSATEKVYQLIAWAGVAQ